MSTLFKDITILEESPSDTDLLGFEEEVKRVSSRISSKITSGKSVIVAYLGAFGIGKSTVLQEIHKNAPEDQEWIFFEAWRFSNRDELWDSFVIKVTSKLTDKSETNIARGFDGRQVNWFWTILSPLAIALALTGISFLAYNTIHDTGGFWEAYLKYAAPTILPASVFIGLGIFINTLAYENPLSRIFQLENHLKKRLRNYDKSIILVLEDIDRTGHDGSVFMETLHEFVRSNKNMFKHPMIIVAPQSQLSFDALDSDRMKRLEHSLKVYDEKIYFGAKVDEKSLNNLFSGIELKTKYQDYRPTMMRVAWELSYYFSKDQLTIRMLKHALREVDWFIEAYPDHNPSVSLVYALSRMLKTTPQLSSQPRLAVNSLAGQASLQNVGGKYCIHGDSVLLACLAIAAGAKGSGEQIGLIDKQGRFIQDSKFSRIKIMKDKNGTHIDQDEVTSSGDVLEVYIRDTYKQQFTHH